MIIFLLICLLFLGLILLMTIAHMPRAKEVGYRLSLGFFRLEYKAKFYKKESRT